MFFDLILYFCVFIFVSILFDFACKNKEKKKIIYLILFLISLLVVTLFLGLRYDVGTDYDSYISLYEIIIKQNIGIILKSNIEIGHYFICKISHYIFNNSQGIILLYALLTNLMVMKSIEKINNKYYGLSYLIFSLYTIPFTLNGMRQGLALAVLFYSFYFLLNKRLKAFLFWCIIASLFHTSALVFIPFGLVYILLGDKYKNKYILVLCGIIIIFIFSGNLLKLSFLSKYANYLDRESTAGYFKIIVRLPILLLLVLMCIKKNKKVNFISTLIFTGFMFMLIGYKANYIDRLSIYFESLIVFIIPYFIFNYKSNKNKLLIIFLLLLYYFSLFIIQFYIKGYHDIFPYSFIELGFV